MVENVFRFENVRVYGEPRFKPGSKIHSPYANYLPFTKAYNRIMVLFGKASRADLRAEVRVFLSPRGDEFLSGEIEVKRHGS